MKPLKTLIPIALLVVGGVFAFAYRAELRDWWFEMNRPKLPAAVRFAPPKTSPEGIGSEQTSPVEGGVATSEHYTLVTTPTAAPKPGAADPFADKGPLPDEVNLAVPFTSQAPYGDWSLPYEDACEETSAIMVNAYYQGETGTIAPATAKKRIDDLVAFEKKFLGFYEDTNAADTAKFIKAYFGGPDALIRPLTERDLKRALANGYPVIIPASGKLLPNPNYRGGGPVYHMFVVKGYTKDRIITNDPGTRRGADYTYTFDQIANAAHDWNGGDVAHGASLMLVVLPPST